jgi:hypothetical protein
MDRGAVFAPVEGARLLGAVAHAVTLPQFCAGKYAGNEAASHVDPVVRRR